MSFLKKKTKLSYMGAIALFLCAFFIPFYIELAQRCNPDNDMWWMMATGRHILETGKVPTINPFVIHEGFSMVVQQWVLAITNFLLYSTFGEVGLEVVALVMFFTNLFLVYVYAGYFTESVPQHLKKAVRIAFAFTSTFFFAIYLNTRPTQFTVCILLLEQLVILAYKKSGKGKYLWWLPVLSLLEINLHGAFWPFIFVMMMPHVVPNVFDRNVSIVKQLAQKKQYVLPIIVSLAAGFVNPYGVKGITYLFSSYNNSKVFDCIKELRAPATSSMDGWYVIISFALLVMYIYISRKSVNIANVYLLAGLLILASMHVRNLWLLVFGIVPIGCELLGRFLKDDFLKPSCFCVYEVIAFVILTAVLIIFECTCMFGGKMGPQMESLPVASVKYLEDNFEKDEVVLFTSFNTGGYMEWYGYKVYMDARPELFQKSVNGVADVADEYFHVMEGFDKYEEYEEFLNRYDFTHLLVENKYHLYLYLKSSDEYEEVVKKEGYGLFERR